MNVLMDLNETPVSCADRTCVRAQNDLLSSVDSLHRNKFSSYKVRNMHFTFNSVIFIIRIDVE
jgi:hypothetical protein